MLWGQAWTSRWGDPDDFLLVYERREIPGGAELTLAPWTGYGDEFFRIRCDGYPQQIIYLVEGETRTVSVRYDMTRTRHPISVVPLGDYDDDTDLYSGCQEEYFQLTRGQKVQVDFPASIETTEAYKDADQLSNWSLTGLERWATGSPGDVKTQAKLNITIADNGDGTYTVALVKSSYVLCSGTGASGGTITLAEQNDSGVSGSVALTFSAELDEDDGAFVVGRWADYYTVVLGSETVTVADGGIGNALSCQLGPFDPGTYNWSITPVSDTGKVGTALTGTKVVPGAPEPPGVPTYVSGDWTNTVIRFASNGSATDRYHVYDSTLDSPTDMAAIAVDVDPDDEGNIDVTLPSLASAGTGFRRVVVETYNGSVESGYRRLITIEYAAGVVVLPRPNAPGFDISDDTPVTNGRTINVDYQYNAANQQGVATQIRLDLKNEAGTITTGTPVALAAAMGGISQGQISATAAADGWFLYKVVALTAAGTASDNAVWQGPKWLSNSSMPAPASAELTVISG